MVPVVFVFVLCLHNTAAISINMAKRHRQASMTTKIDSNQFLSLYSYVQ